MARIRDYRMRHSLKQPIRWVASERKCQRLAIDSKRATRRWRLLLACAKRLAQELILSFKLMLRALVGTDKPYGILPTFRDWRFPSPEAVPKSWRTDRKTVERGDRCYVTQQRFGVELVHIVPQSETEWFNTNAMTQYTRGFPKFTGNTYSAGIDNPHNVMPLRTDLHRLLDQKHLTFTPKRGRDGDTIVVHCLEDPEIASLYHNIPIHGPLQKELLLARFAWTLFPLGISQFLQMGVSRVLWIADGHGNMEEKEVSHKQCQNYALLRSQSSSPKKRPKAKDDDIEDGDLENSSERRSKCSFDSGVYLSDTEPSLQPSEFYEKPRGRKRYRAWEQHVEM